MLTMRPQPASTMSGSTACTQWNTPLQVDVDDVLPVVERQIGESLEAFHPRGVHQDGDRTELFPDCGQRGVDRSAVGDVGGVRELVVGRQEVEGGDVIPVGAQPIRDSLADARAASGDDGRLHGAASVSIVKNLPFEYENRTLALCSIARQIRPNCRIRFRLIAVIRAHD